MQISRRRFLTTAGASLGAVGVIGASGLALHSGAFAQNVAGAPRPLPILPLQDFTNGLPPQVPLMLAAGQHRFGAPTGVDTISATLGINQGYLGPVLRVKNGQNLPIEVTNKLDEVTTLHWHGLHIPGDVDGGPHQEIAPGGRWQPEVPIRQRASMNWFHAHTHGRTAQQTYHGLAGVMLVEDDDSLAADLPQTYGVDDLTLVLQDKSFDASGRLQYVLTGETFEDGHFGDTMVVNGAVAPLLHRVPQGLVRLRVLNASNARFLTLSMGQGPVTVIASDGGFLAGPVETPRLTMAPGERYELLFDMQTTEVNSLQVSFEDEAFPELLGGFLRSAFGGSPIGPQTVVTFTAHPDLPAFTGSVPKTLAVLPPADPSTAVRRRTFELNMGDAEELAIMAANWGNFCGNAEAMGINGRPMNMNHVNETIPLGQTEIWRITADEQLHPFHVHGCSFRILSQNGAAPPAHAAGWKDMVHVQDGASEILVRFDFPAPDHAPYMYHCHILEHEDCGMMGQFTVG